MSSYLCCQGAPVTRTTAGDVRGYTLDGVSVYRGIPYARARRYHMPESPEPWAGVRDALDYGFAAPQMKRIPLGNGSLGAHVYWPEDEDCHTVNVWTPARDADARMPVMIWIHGGGYTHGSANDSSCFDGSSLCGFGGVVVVSFNHRLNILGCLDLSEYGEEYRNSGNLVMADIVAALGWVRDNIAAFGGDPDNVTVFGHSSGGAKVSNLLQTPCADGLFHRAIIQTGIIPPALRIPRADGQAVARGLVKRLALRDIRQIEEIPLDRLIAAWQDIAPALRAQGVKVEWGVHPNDYYIGDPLVVGLRRHALEIPILSGTALGEFWALNTFPGTEAFAGKPALLQEKLTEKFGARSEALQRLFAKAYPEKDPAMLLALDSHGRQCNLQFMELASKLGHQRLFAYLFAFDFPYRGLTPAWHGAEIPFVFHNTAMVPVCQKGEVTRRLERQTAGAWVRFARTGDPNGDDLPAWRSYTQDHKETMLLDEACKVRCDYDRELVDMIEEVSSFFH